MKSNIHSVFCILPPHILKHIIEKGTLTQRQKAIRTIQLTTQLRNQRSLPSQELKPPIEIISTAVKERLVFSADHGSTLPGRLVRSEGNLPIGDMAVDEAYDGAGATFDLFWENYQRNSIDGQGMNLQSTVHYQKNYDNAFWNGQQMVYGDGDEDLPSSERLFNRFTASLDVIAHELTHGVTQYEANLVYMNQSGALNESISDVFGILAKQKKLNLSAAQSDWIIGQGLFTDNVSGYGIRSMKAPGTAYDDPVLGKDPQPAHMDNYVHTFEDNGGVHLNSGIPNHAFYIAAMEMGGYAWEKAGKIWYLTLSEKLNSGDGFQAAANLTYATAGELFGDNSLEQKSIKKAWTGVGIEIGGTEEKPGCLPGLIKILNLGIIKKGNVR